MECALTRKGRKVFSLCEVQLSWRVKFGNCSRFFDRLGDVISPLKLIATKMEGSK